MKKLIYLFILGIGFTSCSVESVDSTENLLTADAKVEVQDVVKSMHLLDTEICAGESPVFVFNFPQNTTGNGLKETDIQIQLLNPLTSEYEQFKKFSFPGAGPESFTPDEVLGVGTYNFRASIGSGGFDYYATLDVIVCSDCDESFNYTVNEDGSYTFTYTPSEDMPGAEVIFTFAQSVVASGYDWPTWNGTSSTRKEVMELEACEDYTWTLFLTPDCEGSSGPNNVWTDFKVNGVSKKNENTPTLKQSCS